jgi:superfamily I DNA and/or RNA helicase
MRNVFYTYVGVLQVVLGGDPRQLGPVIHSPAAKKFGLSMSLLERLIACPLYSRGASGVHPGAGNGECFNRKYMTMLVRNYRSHSLLLQIPNNLFYNGALKARADPAIVNARLHWDGLPTKGVPLFWHGVVGKEEREASSPSWFNGDEAVCILKHVMSLLRMRPDCKQHDIGIITPYNKQVHKITRLLRANDMRDIKVGSAEMFQGQERQVILVSTVRSSHDVTGFDAKHNIGFLDNPKRFNVAGASAHCPTPDTFACLA